MEMSKSNITKLVNESNKILNKYNFNIKKGFDNEYMCNLHISENGNLRDNFYLLHINKNSGEVIIESIEDKPRGKAIKKIAEYTPERYIEFTTFITLILFRYIINKGPFNVKITQSTNGWTPLKLLIDEDYRICCIYSEVLKAAMKNNLVNVVNARLTNKDSIIVKKGTYAGDIMVMHPDSDWKISDWYVEKLIKMGYLTRK